MEYKLPPKKFKFFKNKPLTMISSNTKAQSNNKLV